MKMPPRSQVVGVNAATLWKGARGIAPAGLAVDMSSFGNSVVMTAPTAFARYEDPAERLAALVLTSDASYSYQSFGDTEGLAPLLG
ncbi:hypothetical protein, partial [Martelella sp. UBA3392]|uniref:hypothetical protein n=1 Tax=Martelella sp. UBA3392 TaxID=1946834 RepID=UPI0039C919EB